MGFSRQEYWSGLPFPSPRNLLNLGIESRSPALQADSLQSESLEKPKYSLKVSYSLAPWKKSYDKPRQLLKSRDITLPTNVWIVKAMVFPGVMYRYESRTIRRLRAKELMLLNCGAGEDS